MYRVSAPCILPLVSFRSEEVCSFNLCLTLTPEQYNINDSSLILVIQDTYVMCVLFFSFSDICKIYLEQKNYEMAKRYAIGNREHMDIILVSQAEHYFKDQRYVQYHAVG